MKLHPHDDPSGPPCNHMKGSLERTADGTANWLQRWYALVHAARCGRCHRFLNTITQMLGRLKQVKAEETDPEALARLKDGAWREALAESK